MSAAAPQPERVAVVGSGVMGAAIAYVFAAARFPVSLYDPDERALDAAIERIRAIAGTLTGDPSATLSRIATTSDLAAAADAAALIIEAGPEVLAVKHEIFQALEAVARPDAVLASNTSAIPIRDIAAATSSARRVLGTHFWNPPHLVPLVEVIQSDATGSQYIDRAIAFLTQAAMSPVHVRADVPGFVGNRLQHALKREAIALVAQGICDAATVDEVVKQGFGARLGLIGPLEQSDLSGLELTLQIHEVVMPALDNTPAPHPLLLEKVEQGDLGAATGKGFREWHPGEAQALRERVDSALLEAARRRREEAGLRPTVSASDEGDALWGLGGLWIVRVRAAETGGVFALIEARMQEGCATPLHRHASDETFIVLEGSLALLIGDRRVTADAGAVVHLPGGEIHAWRVESRLARFLVIADPEHEAFYRDASTPAERLTQPPDAGVLDLERIGVAARRNGVELLAPPPEY